MKREKINEGLLKGVRRKDWKLVWM